MNIGSRKGLKGSTMLWCVILMSILALVVLLTVSVAAAYDKSVAKRICLNQLEYDAESAIKLACANITDDIYQNGTEPDIPLFGENGTEIYYNGNIIMSSVMLNWNKTTNTLTAVASVPEYGESSVSAVFKKNEQIIIDDVAFPPEDPDLGIEYLSSAVYTPDHYWYELDSNTYIDSLNYGGEYFFVGDYLSDLSLTFDTVGNNSVRASVYIYLTHEQKLEISNVPPNVSLFIVPSPQDKKNAAEVTISDTEEFAGLIQCGTLNTEALITPEMPDPEYIELTAGYSYEFERFTY